MQIQSSRTFREFPGNDISHVYEYIGIAKTAVNPVTASFRWQIPKSRLSEGEKHAESTLTLFNRNRSESNPSVSLTVHAYSGSDTSTELAGK